METHWKKEHEQNMKSSNTTTDELLLIWQVTNRAWLGNETLYELKNH